MLLHWLLESTGHPGLVHCDVTSRYVATTTLPQCWPFCKLRSCLPKLNDSAPVSAQPLKLVMTGVEEVRVDEDGIVRPLPIVVTSSQTAHALFQPFFADHLEAYEAVRVILLNQQSEARGVLTIGQGGIAGTIADHRLLFAAALKTLSSSVIVAHNHPSGTLKPSKADREWTKRAQDIGELHDITIRDHLILGATGYYSFADERLL